MPVPLPGSFLPAFGAPWHIENMQRVKKGLCRAKSRPRRPQATFLGIKSPGPPLLLGMGGPSEILTSYLSKNECLVVEFRAQFQDKAARASIPVVSELTPEEL